jgi:hypothetical protein
MDANGGTPKDFHRAIEAKQNGQPPVHDKPVHQDVEALKLEVEVPEWRGPRSIQFANFADLQQFIAAKGPIPQHVRVAVGPYVMQSGG